MASPAAGQREPPSVVEESELAMETSDTGGGGRKKLYTDSGAVIAYCMLSRYRSVFD